MEENLIFKNRKFKNSYLKDWGLGPRKILMFRWYFKLFYNITENNWFLTVLKEVKHYMTALLEYLHFIGQK